jgi:uncharacterized protein YgbK (DUF1537 family)
MSSHLSKEIREGMSVEDLAAALPPPWREAGARRRIRERVVASGTLVAVADDDPTGTQTVHDVPVLFRWSARALEPAFSTGEPLLFISTNSRSLDGGAAARTARALGHNAARAARHAGRAVSLVSRSDSTLRGHFPREVDELARGLGAPPDITVLAPAFFEGGRLTAGDVHWVLQGGRLVPAGSTEFARDPVFGFRSSNLKLWVEEKTGGRVRAGSVLSLSLDLIRTGGPAGVAQALREANSGSVVVVNACAYEDLEVVVLGMLDAEERGRRFLCRTAASFVKVRAGIEDRQLLSAAEIGADGGPVLFVVGSYVQKTALQLSALLAAEGVGGVEFHAEAARTRGSLWRECADAARRVSACLAQGRSAVLYTSRTVRVGADFLRFGASLMQGLCSVVRRLDARPSAVVAKGGITSIQVARAGLRADGARVAGQVLPGVPVWRLGEGCLYPGLPYVVFPGNVGGDGALVDVLTLLRPRAGA